MAAAAAGSSSGRGAARCPVSAADRSSRGVGGAGGEAAGTLLGESVKSWPVSSGRREE